MQAATLPTELFTIGYEALRPALLVDLLKRSRVEILLDVRAVPVSRKPGFAKNALAELLTVNGIGYRHVPEFGCPREVRHAYRDSGDWPRYTREFMRFLKTRESELSDFADLIAASRCCLLCLEEDFNFCHRKYVAEALADRVPGGVRISHLTGPIQGRVVLRPTSLVA
jgi:uncharacterized protein (DUF488 family)